MRKKTHIDNILYHLDIVKLSNIKEVAYNQPTLWATAPDLQQLCLPPKKPQIVSIPGISPKRRDRYRVMIGERILGDNLSLDEALILAKRGGK
jgi:hypothetical protein